MILVTGANGFVGTALCHQLVPFGASVRGAIRRLDRSIPCIEGTELLQVGECNPLADWSEALDGIRTVVHLAARVHVMHDKANDPLTAFRLINTEGTLNLARQAAKADIRRFIYLSSIKVNGEQTLRGRPFSAQDLPAPIDPYGISKHEAEEGLRKLAQQTGMEVVIIRPPLIYGSGVKANFLNMMRWLYKGVPLPFGAIHNRRSLVALDNLLDLIVTCLDHPAAANQTFLVSDGEDISTTELLGRMAIALHVPTRLLSVPQKLLEVGFKMAGKNDLAQRICGSLQVDITNTCTVLDWKPSTPVDEGLRRTAEHFLRSRS